MKKYVLMLLMLTVLFFTACSPQIKLFQDGSEPLNEFTIQGSGDDKILMISVNGFISDAPREGFLTSRPSMVKEIVSQLALAQDDADVKAVILKVDSPGGTVTASDILYHEIMKFKQRSGKKIVVTMMNLAASGGYYISLPADFILAHPTTITGSIGVIFSKPKFHELMDKIGVSVDINRSGQYKDMGSPYRETTPEEQEIFQELINEMAGRFIGLVKKHRELDQKTLDLIATARIFSANEAQEIGMVDKIGYLDDAVSETVKIANLGKDPRIVVYRYSQKANDNLYNVSTPVPGKKAITLMELGLPEDLKHLRTGFYYLWAPE